MQEKWKRTDYSLVEAYNLISDDESAYISEINIVNDKRNCAFGYATYWEYTSSLNIDRIFVNTDTRDTVREELFRAMLVNSSLLGHGWGAMNRAASTIKEFLSFAANKKPISKGSLVEDYERYTEYLLHQTRVYTPGEKKGLMQSTANTKQTDVRTAIEEIIGDDSCSHVTQITSNTFQKQHTMPAEEKYLSTCLNHHTAVFEQITDWLLGSNKFPFVINTLGITCHVFPNCRALISIEPSEVLFSKSGNQCINPGFNYKTGKLRKAEELADLVQFRELKLDVGRYIKEAKKKLENANNVQMHPARVMLMNMAVAAYHAQFLMVTGMNDAPVAAMKMGEIEYRKGVRKFTAVKIRGFKKDVSFEVQTQFLKYFRRYLELRDFVLRVTESECDAVFLRVGRNGKVKPYVQDGTSHCKNAKKSPFRSLLPHVTVRQYRVTKGQWIAKRQGAEVASFVLQHSITTNSRSYNGTSQETTDKEVSEFFDQLHTRIVKVGRDDLVPTAAGRCAAPNNPEFEAKDFDSYKPNCKRFEGCLFCKHYVVHADSEDIRKLMSILFLTGIYRRFADDQSSYDIVVQPLSERVQQIIAQVEMEYPIMKIEIERIRRDVFENENLTHYWAAKYEMIDELGVA